MGHQTDDENDYRPPDFLAGNPFRRGATAGMGMVSRVMFDTEAGFADVSTSAIRWNTFF